MGTFSRLIVMGVVATSLMCSRAQAQNSVSAPPIRTGPARATAEVPNQQPPSTITREWVAASYLKIRSARDTGDFVPPPPFLSVRKRPEVAMALVDIANDSTSPGLSRNNAILLLGRTGQDRAYQFLAEAFDSMPPGARLRFNVILAMGNGYPDRPPSFIYDRLEQALSKAPPEEREAAAMALGDIQSPRALSILRARLPLEPSPTIQKRIRRGLTKVQK
jgi:hypothetical protein